MHIWTVSGQEITQIGEEAKKSKQTQKCSKLNDVVTENGFLLKALFSVQQWRHNLPVVRASLLDNARFPREI